MDSNVYKVANFTEKRKDDLFSKGKVHKNIAWQRVAEKFNSTSEVIVTWEQCSNKWKKLEERCKKIQEHNVKTGNDRKDMEFYEELSDFFGSDPKIIPCSSVSSMAANPCKGDETSSDEEDAARSEAPKKKRKRKSKSTERLLVAAQDQAFNTRHYQKVKWKANVECAHNMKRQWTISFLDVRY